MNSQIELLKWMHEDIRKETISGIEHLSADQLFKSPFDNEYPVGSYLMHIAECEIFWLEVLSGKEQPEELKKRSYYDKWFDTSGKPEPPDKPIELTEYLNVMSATTANLLNHMSQMKDEELDEEVTYKFKNGEKKFSKKWIIYHLIEHEVHHRGQIFMLIRKAGWNKK